MQFLENNIPNIEELNESGANIDTLELTTESDAPTDLPEREIGRVAAGLLSNEINMGLYRRRRMLVSR